MLHVQESSASLPLSLGSTDSTTGGPSWLEDSHPSSLASSVSDGASMDSQSKKNRDRPLWRSFFASRSRSVPESAPASPTAEAHSSTSSGPREQWNGSTDEQTASLYESSISEKSMNSNRTSFFKGRWTSSRQTRERRSSVHSTHDESDEPTSRSHSRASMGRKESTLRTLSLRPPKRPSVSQPFNFQHLTHALPNGSSTRVDSDCDTPGLALSLSDAQNLSAMTDVRHSYAMVPPVSETAPSRPPPPPPTPAVQDISPEESHIASHAPWRLSQLMETSPKPERSRSGPRRPSRVSTLVVPPPRTSSRMALVRADEMTGVIVGPRPLSADVEIAGLAPEHDSVTPLDEAHQTFLIGADPPATWPLDNNSYNHSNNNNNNNTPQLPHAVTTPDDSAWPLPVSSYLGSGSTLPDVPEEDEACLSPRSSTFNSTRQSSFSSHLDGSLPDLQTAVIATAGRASVVPPGRAFAPMRPLSTIVQGRPTGHLNNLHTTERSTTRTTERFPFPVEAQHVDDSWDADIDYCYENAVEASCDYEWAPTGLSTETDRRAVAGTLLAISTDTTSIPSLTPDRERFEDGSSDDSVRRMDEADWDSSPVLPHSRPHRPTLLTSATVAMPGLDGGSAMSSALESEVETPSSPRLLDAAHTSPPFRSAFLRNPFKESGLFVVDHSLCVPPEEDERLVSEAIHESALGRDGVHVVRHYSVQESVEEVVTESELESCPSRSSLCKTSSFNSVDSGEGNSPGHFEQRLVGTVPELVHSRRGSAEERDTFLIHQSGDDNDNDNDDDDDDSSTQAPPSPRRRLTKKASSHSNLRYAAVDPEIMMHSYRERSQSDGTPKAAAAAAAAVVARRKVEGRAYSRQRSTSSFRGPRPLNPSSRTRSSYVLFPTS
ncbi:MAG: hypothetical protein M1823_003577 [Watsoniomyces obsoletus]|nr:MAG: hypothetical protein M1823_003577 [Watsoniomyces obsoletus]